MSKILVIDDERAIRNTLKDVLELEGHTLLLAENGRQGLELAQSEQLDLIFSDIKMPEVDGMEFLQQCTSEAPIVIISGHGTIETAVEAVKLGAFDFLEKPIDLNRLLQITKHALDNTSLVRENKSLKKKVNSKYQMIGDSAALKRVRDIINKVAPTDARVLITGENGTGKEVVARLLHAESRRSTAPLVEVNCAAIPSELIESELFGHMKGSFTGAIKDRTGKFEQADGGTLFLDEIGDLSLDAQAKVLRALQENEITRVGSDRTIKVNVRVLAATNKNLHQEIERGHFREDLFHRLNVIPIHVPTLDERKEDIPALVTYFAEQICAEQGWKTKTFAPEAIALLQTRTWRGNIRELRNVIERLIILADQQITPHDIELFA